MLIRYWLSVCVGALCSMLQAQAAEADNYHFIAPPRAGALFDHASDVSYTVSQELALQWVSAVKPVSSKSVVECRCSQQAEVIMYA